LCAGKGESSDEEEDDNGVRDSYFDGPAPLARKPSAAQSLFGGVAGRESMSEVMSNSAPTISKAVKLTLFRQFYLFCI
jgi:hypothetical protein